MPDLRKLLALIGGRNIVWRMGVLALAFATPAPAGEQLPADLARVSPDALALLSVPMADLWQRPALQPAKTALLGAYPDLSRSLERLIGTAPENVVRLTLVLPNQHGTLGNLEPLFYVLRASPADPRQLVTTVLPGAKEQKRNGQSLHAAGRKALYLIGDRAYVLGEIGEIQSLLDRGPAVHDGPLSAALRQATGIHTAVAGINVEPILKIRDAIDGALPPEAEPFLPLLEARHAVFACDLNGNDLKATLRLGFDGDAKAREAVKALKALLDLGQRGTEQAIALLGNDKDGAPIVVEFNAVRSALQNAAVATHGKTLEAAATAKLDVAALGAAIVQQTVKVRSRAERTQGFNNLKQIALAMHNFHDSYKSFPPAASYDQNGKPLLSWRVSLLPYLGQTALYNQFHFDEPWDSEHNKKLLLRMPRVYAAPGAKLKPGETCYLGFVGKGALFEGKKGTPIMDITDGTSNTIMIVEAATSVPWTKPDDLPFGPGKPLPKLGFRPDGFSAALCDGSVRFFPRDKITPEKLRLYITRNGGEIIPAD